MKKITLLALLLLFVIVAAKAQTIDISGTVKDDEGHPVHFAFVKDIQSKNATYTDTLGQFTIKANANSSLYINCFGYTDAVVKIDGKTNIVAILSTAVSISNSKNTTSKVSPTIGDASVQQLSAAMSRDQIASPGVSTKNVTVVAPNSPPALLPQNAKTFNMRVATFDASPGSIFPVFNPKEETQGNRYLFKGWIHGYVINAKDSVIEDPSSLFEYDKMGGGLLMTRNKISAIEVDRDMVQSFTLYDEGNVAYTFENVKQINPSHYVQVISSCDKYKIYKDIKTTFEKSNFASDGLYSTGHNYDEYKDEYTYYVYDVKTKALQPLSLKKKAIKVAFASDADKLNKFMSDHSSDSIDDMYLEELCSSLNE